MNVRACGCFLAALFKALSFTSQSATMFSLPTLCRFEPPRPPEPMMAMFNFSLRFLPRRKAGALRRNAPVAADDFKKQRRVSERVAEEAIVGMTRSVNLLASAHKQIRAKRQAGGAGQNSSLP